MDEELIKQVRVLSDTVKAQTDRLDQAFKRLDETTKQLEDTEALLQVTNEALKKSLHESDRAVDDMATMVVALQTEISRVQEIQAQQQAQSNA